MLRILADENVPRPVIQLLRARGHDVKWAREVARGANDPAVLALARADHRVVVTFDKDFGELAFRACLPAECGIVLFRLSGSNPEHDNARVVAALESSPSWSGQFTVVTDGQVRIRPLPPVV